MFFCNKSLVLVIVFSLFCFCKVNAQNYDAKKILESKNPVISAQKFKSEVGLDVFLENEVALVCSDTHYEQPLIDEAFLIFLLEKNNRLDIAKKLRSKDYSVSYVLSIMKKETSEFWEHCSRQTWYSKILSRFSSNIDNSSSWEEYSTDWFSSNIKHWEKILDQYGLLNTKKEVKCLEIGSWQGKSSVYIARKMLTNPKSQLYCLDTFEGSMENNNPEENKLLLTTFLFNISLTDKADQVKILKGQSLNSLRYLLLDQKETFDFAYIDGSHTAYDVLTDALLVFPLIKKGGLIFFDDYEWSLYDDPLLCPKLGINTFLEIMKDNVRIIKKGYQLYIEKI